MSSKKITFENPTEQSVTTKYLRKHSFDKDLTQRHEGAKGALYLSMARFLPFFF
jgi:hypothetical protein